MQIGDAARLVVLLVAIWASSGCNDSPTSPSPGDAPSPGQTVPDGSLVRGSERLAWNQAGNVSRMRFRAYIDDQAVELPSATCNGSNPAMCTAPLPALADGIHAIALVNVNMDTASESARTDSITVQKISSGVTTAASFPDAAPYSRSLRLEARLAADLSVTVDIVARNVNTPAQLAALPDGRLLIAEANGHVRMIHPSEPGPGEDALDAHALLRPSPLGPLGLASHPDFTRNGFVYLSFLTLDSGGRALIRIVRLREAGNTLGDPASLFEAPVRSAVAGSVDADYDFLTQDGPKIAFGPDGLLYVALPLGVDLDLPYSGTPGRSFLRVNDNGQLPTAEPVSGIDSHPLGFTWREGTAELVALFARPDGEVLIKTFGSTRNSRARVQAAGLHLSATSIVRSGPARWQDGSFPSTLTRQFLDIGSPRTAPRVVRLTRPIEVAAPASGFQDRVDDAAISMDGTVFVATRGERRKGVVARLTSARH